MKNMDDKRFYNFLTICFGLELFTKGIYDFVVDNIKTEHTKLYRICASGACTKQNCSKRFKMLRDWCQSCRKWKAELKKIKSDECRHWNKINWQELSSSDWPQSIDEMAKVFVKDPSSNYRDGVFYDICAVLSIFTNMNIFAFDKTTLKEIKRIRNEYYGHNNTNRLHDTEKNIFFDRILRFIRLKKICRYRSAIECIPDLEKLQKTDDLKKLFEKEGLNDFRDDLLQNFPRFISPERALVVQNEIAANSQLYSDFKSRLNELIVKDELKKESEIIDSRSFVKKQTKFKMRYEHLLRLLLFSALFVMLEKPTADTKGCLSMRFQHSWMSDIDFDFYIQELYNASIIDRVWMEPEVTSGLKKQKHVLLSAQLGYGKSSTVSQILCAEMYSPWNRIRTMTVAYHMCRFNHKDSIQSYIFIRNLAGKIVNSVPELGNAILADVYALDFLDFKCKQDPFSCLEVVIIAPLKRIKTDSKYLVIIDALDECDTPMGNDLYDLLAKKLVDFPSFFQFLFTSRKINKVLYEFKTLQNIIEIDLNSFTERNILDALRFIELTSNLTAENKLQLVHVSVGNLLHVNSYLDYCRGNISCEFSKVPKTLEYVYHANLERIVGMNTASFEDWTAMFEVLCAAANPININELFVIAGLDNDKQRRKFSILLGNEFGHFLKNHSNKLSFQHKAFKEFLTNELRKHMLFYIDITKGHTLLSRYYIRIHTSQNIFEEKVLVDIAYHVALTYNKQIAETFLQLYNRTNLQNDKILYYLAREVNCYETANLVIHLINQSGVSSLIMSHAAFTASANGNHKTLISFLGNNFNFKSKYSDILEHTMKGADLVYMCKFVFFCGYNVFHIAAQRGYVEIVEYLLENYPDILYEQNKIQLNAFQLAAENGHTKIVKVFLGIDSSLADQHSLYYASQQGHNEIVSLLLKYVNDTCLPCNGTIYWLPPSSIRKQKNVTFPIEALNKNSVHFQTLDFFRISQILSNAILSDDWRLITCESAVNAAVRNGHLRIVKSLLEQEVNALHCTMFDGSTPLMTAAKYDQAEIFRYLHSSGGNLDDRCNSNLTYEDRIEITESDLLKEKACPQNGSISHLLAIHNSFNIIKYLLNNGFDDWETNDGNGLTPSHYAFCCNSNHFINFVVFAEKQTGHLKLNVKSPNGSTSYHSAAICKSLILSHYVDPTIRRLPDQVDNNNRSVLHYGLMPPVSQEDAITTDRVGKDYFSDLLLRVIINNEHDYQREDTDGRNFLHYAASSGNYWTFLKILQILKKEDINVLLNRKDKKGNTPLSEAFNSMTHRRAFESVKIPLNCSLNELFSSTCKANLSVILLPHEYFIFTVSEYLSTTNYFRSSNVKDCLILAINKSRIYPILTLKTYASKEFDAIVSSSTEMPNLLAKSDMHIIAEYIFNADNSLRCNKTESPLHQLVLNAMNGQDNSFLIPLFKKFSSQYLDCCYDKEGYNILHRAAMGGNIQTVKLMLTKGMNVSYSLRNDQNVLELCIYSSPFLKNGHVPSYYVGGPRFPILEYVSQSETLNKYIDRTQTVDFDSTADLLVNEMSRYFEKNRVKQKLCDGKNIGLLHIGAAKGLMKFLKRVHSIFGTHILRCSDRFNVSLYYLAQMYGQTDIVKWMNNIKLKFRTPIKVVQNILTYNLISNYLTKSHHDWTCFQDYTFKYRALITNQAMKCISRVPPRRIFFGNMYHRNVSEFLYKSIFFDFTVLNEYTLGGEDEHFIEIVKDELQTKASDFMQLFALSRMKRYANIIRKHLLLFLEDDGEFFYRCLETRGMQTKEPLSDYEINELFEAISSKTYQDFQKLQVRRELHREWLHDIITEKVGINFDARGFHKFITKRINKTLTQFEDVVQLGKDHLLERINFADAEFDSEISDSRDDECFFVFTYILKMLSGNGSWQSALKHLFHSRNKEDIVLDVECFFKIVIDRGDDKFTKKINAFKSLLDKALQDRNWDKGDFLSSSFHFVLTQIRDLYTKYFEKGVFYTVIFP